MTNFGESGITAESRQNVLEGRGEGGKNKVCQRLAVGAHCKGTGRGKKVRSRIKGLEVAGD